MVASAFLPQMTITGQVFSKVPLSSITIQYEEIDFNQPFSTLTGVITKGIGSPVLSGTGTKFTTELTVGDFVFFNSGAANTSVIQEILQILSPFDAIVNEFVFPLSGDVDYINQPFFRFDTQPPTTTPVSLLADPTAITASKAGRRFYYEQFYAWNWNTNAIENLAQTYATSVGGNLQDLGWEDEASWVSATQTLLTYGGWNATITTVAPDPTTIDNSNQEIVLYYTTDTLTFNGTATNVVNTISFIEQSNVVQNYSQELGSEPFKSTADSTMMQVGFDATEYFGAYVPSPSQTNPTGVPPPDTTVPAQYGDNNVLIALLTSTYDSTSSFTLEDQDFTEGQFQVFMKYTIYDGLEAIAAEKLAKQGIQVTPENVDWFRKSIEQLGQVEEIDWPFDEAQAPVQDDPEEYSPEDYDPASYKPRNAKEEV